MHKLDEALSNALLRVTNKWCSITGKSNFALARLSIKVAYVLLVTSLAFEFSWLSPFLALAWTWIVWAQLKRYKRIEEETTKMQEGGTLSVSLQLHQDARACFMDRMVWTLMGVFFMGMAAATLNPNISGVGVLLAGLANYFVLHYNQGGKSVWARAKDKVKAFAKKIPDLIPRPVPRPIPIPVRS